ncbi:MAG TPA: SRPBCC domain-containing protein [Bacteriovoracaceae bacterium]|nr:SRPBCC domain-containing protein [Bacteriovoracaceae bacterium]
MSYELKLTRVFNADKADVFNYFTNPALLECWSYPDGFELKVPYFENNLGGKYRYEHRDEKGDLYVCTGHFKDYETNKKLVSVEEVTNPQGEIVFKDLESEILFRDDPRGCRLEVVQKGFMKERDVEDCRVGWEQCFNRLDSLFQQFTESTL